MLPRILAFRQDLAVGKDRELNDFSKQFGNQKSEITLQLDHYNSDTDDDKKIY